MTDELSLGIGLWGDVLFFLDGITGSLGRYLDWRVTFMRTLNVYALMNFIFMPRWPCSV